MDFTTMQKEVAAACGLDYTDSPQSTLIKRWINTAQKFIYSKAPWPFLRAPNPIQTFTVADYSTGTITTVAASKTGTLSTAPTGLSFTGYYLQTSSGNDWYRIASHTTSATTFTLDNAALVSGSALTFKIRKFYYLASDPNAATTPVVDRILQINMSAAPYHLEERTKETLDSILPGDFATGVPRVYVMAGQDSNQVWQFKLWPSPSSVISLYIEYLLVGTDLSADADISLIPEKWHRNAVLEGAMYQGYRFLNDTRAGDARTLEAFMAPIIESMKEEYMPSMNLHRVLRSTDEYPMRNEFPLPVNYPNV